MKRLSEILKLENYNYQIERVIKELYGLIGELF